MRYQEIKSLLENQELDEVRMGSSDLQKFLKSPLAQSMKAGFESELIFSGGNESRDDYEPEYDYNYDADERVDNIDDIINFYQGGDFSDLGPRQSERIREEMLNEYLEWRDEQLMSDFIDKAEELIKDWIEGDDWDFDSKIEEYLRDEMELSDREVESALTAGQMWSRKIESSKQQAEIRKKNKNFDNYINASDGITDQLDHRVEEAINDHNDDWDSAYENFLDTANEESDYDETEWLRSQGINSAQDVEGRYDLIWPHMYDQNEGLSGDGEFNKDYAESLASSLEQDLDVDTIVSSGYHSARRDDTTWIFEPDSSLTANQDEDMPVEIVSPPMPLPETIEMLPKFFKWAEDNGAYANESTGFHMSVSLPDHASDNIDFTKLALFLGDEYVLQSFDRAANTYCKSAISKIKSSAKGIDITASFNQMRNHLSQLASNSLAKPSGFGKYTSINPKEKYIEFRSAGGMNYFEDMSKIQNTLLRYAYATTIASNPKLEREEYAKKLYKLFADAMPEDQTIIQLFSQYSSGVMPVSTLKDYLKQVQFKREVEKNKYVDKKMWWNVTLGNHSMELVATGEPEAKNKAALEWGIRDQRGMIASPIRPYEEQPVSEPVRGNNASSQEYIMRRRAGVVGAGNVAYRFSATDVRDAMEKARQWATSQGIPRQDFLLQRADDQELANVTSQRSQSIPDVPIDVAQNFR
jgi:hypothetical protein